MHRIRIWISTVCCNFHENTQCVTHIPPPPKMFSNSSLSVTVVFSYLFLVSLQLFRTFQSFRSASKTQNKSEHIRPLLIKYQNRRVSVDIPNKKFRLSTILIEKCCCIIFVIYFYLRSFFCWQLLTQFRFSWQWTRIPLFSPIGFPNAEIFFFLYVELSWGFFHDTKIKIFKPNEWESVIH